MTKKYRGCILAGLAAGAVTGLLGAGGGMVLIPLLQLISGIPEEELFPSSVAIILPTVAVTLLTSHAPICFTKAVPYLAGSCLGGILAGLFGRKIPTVWLHRILGAIALWGGIRYIC